MERQKAIPVIDLFAGPGGLAEGFSSIFRNNKRIFDIKLSIEKDDNAHKTLELRSFYRQFGYQSAPPEYYDLIREKNLLKREKKRNILFEKYPIEAAAAKIEAWHCELGNERFPNDLIDEKIRNGLNSRKDWILIGGPPCQAYSLAGRSRVGGINDQDHRVYLYKEYLRIIAKHHPAVFVMENVKGLLSAKVDGEKVFDWMLKDLASPSSVFKGLNSPSYKIHSLVVDKVRVDKDYLIKAEDYGIPQKRHRVILLGIRQDTKGVPSQLLKKQRVSLADVIEDLPRIRSGLNRKFSHVENGKRKYLKVKDSQDDWSQVINDFRKNIVNWNGFSRKEIPNKINAPKLGMGSEFIGVVCAPKKLRGWYNDPRLTGVPNHESRTHLVEDLNRYLFAAVYSNKFNKFPRMADYEEYGQGLLPDHKNATSGKFADRFRVQLAEIPATTVTSHIAKDGHYFIHYDAAQCRSFTVREAARIQTFPDNYLFCGSRTAQYHQVGNAVPPYLARQIGEIVWGIFKVMNNE